MVDAMPMLVRVIRMLQIPRIQGITLSLITQTSLFAKTLQISAFKFLIIQYCYVPGIAPPIAQSRPTPHRSCTHAGCDTPLVYEGHCPLRQS